MKAVPLPQRWINLLAAASSFLASRSSATSRMIFTTSKFDAAADAATTRRPSGAHFGGSLFAMTDPFYALMLANIAGAGLHTIWDQGRERSISVSPGRGTVVTAIISDLDDETIAGCA